MVIDQNLVKLFFTVAETLAPIALNKIVEIVKDKTDFDKAVEIVDTLLRSNIAAAESTIKNKLVEASEDGEITADEVSELKDLVVKNVKKALSSSIVNLLNSKQPEYIEARYDEIACEVKDTTQSMVNEDGSLNINAILPM